MELTLCIKLFARVYSAEESSSYVKCFYHKETKKIMHCRCAGGNAQLMLDTQYFFYFGFEL
jgi:hypothetical protein